MNIETNWFVITGAPCSGKTSVIRELETMGNTVVHEAARNYIEIQLAAGKTLEEIKADELAFERHILYQKVSIESNLEKTDLIFLDRAIPDSIAYFITAGLDPSEPLKKSRLFRYRKIFLFERFHFETDRVRSENDIIADRIERLIADSYRNLGYDVIRVPPVSIHRRVQWMMNSI